jgi:asparagine synthase (glutamine-hydrolysing)
MAQIIGCYVNDPQDNGETILRDMAVRMRRPTQPPAQTWSPSAAGGGIGVLLGHEFGALATGKRPDDGCAVALDGRLTSPALAGEELAVELLGKYRRNGPGFVAQLRGSFALAVYDATQRRLVCATDRVATRSLYWTHLPGLFAVSTELKGFLALPNLKVEMDPEAVAAYLRYGHLFGSRTLWRNIHRLRPGTILEYDAARDTVHESVYWRVEGLVQQRRPLTPDRLDALSTAFRGAVLRGCPQAGQGRVGLSLSGGLDSRAILSVLAGEKYPVNLRTEGVAGCVDERVAAALAEKTGNPWRFSALQTFDIAQYIGAMWRYVYLTEGMMVPEGYPGISAQQFAVEENLAVLQRGHGGEMARVGDAWPFQVRDQVLRQRTRGELVSYLEPAGGHADPRWLRLFTDAGMRKAIEEPGDTYANFISQFDAALTPAETLSLMYLYINESGSVAAYRNSLRGYVDMALPYADDDFLELVLGTDVTQRRDETIHHHIIRTHCPPLMKIANSNNGAPLDASRLQRVLTEKFLILMRRLSLPGFRHYHNVENWIRNTLRESVRSLLLEPRTQSRGLYDPEALRALLDDTEAPGNSRLLARLVMLEIWSRMFIDREIESYQFSLENTPPMQGMAGLASSPR